MANNNHLKNDNLSAFTPTCSGNLCRLASIGLLSGGTGTIFPNSPPIAQTAENETNEFKIDNSSSCVGYLTQELESNNHSILLKQNSSPIASSITEEKWINYSNLADLNPLTDLNLNPDFPNNLNKMSNFPFFGENLLQTSNMNLQIPNSITNTTVSTLNCKKKKKAYKELTLEEKVELIRLADANNSMSQASIAERYQIAKSNVCRILQRKNEYLSALQSFGYAATRKRKIRSVVETTTRTVEMQKSEKIAKIDDKTEEMLNLGLNILY